MASPSDFPAERPYYKSQEFERVFNKIVDMVNAGSFNKINYTPEGKITVDAGILLKPEIRLQEGSFATMPSRNMREHRDQIASWRWGLLLDFAEDVSVELFLQQLMDSPIILPRDDCHDRQVRIRLVGGNIIHPPRQAVNGGTKVRLDFEVQPSRL